MASNEFKYTIRADDRSKEAVRSAERNMGSMENSAKRLGNALKTAFTVGAVVAVGKAIVNVTSDLVRAYAQQEQAERKLAAAASQNPLLDDSSVKSLRDFATQLQRVTTIGDETTLSFAGMLASFGRTEEQIQDIITAAVDLSAATGISLDSAIRNLNKTFGGLTGELGELIPDLKELTEEELRQGRAVEEVGRMFAGLGEEMTDTTDGAMKQFKNAWGDLKELLGEGMAPVFTGILTFLTDLVEGMSEFISKMRELKEARDAVAEGTATGGQQVTVLQAEINAIERRIASTRRTMSDPRLQGNTGAMERLLTTLEAERAALVQAAGYLAVSAQHEKEQSEASARQAEATAEAAANAPESPFAGLAGAISGMASPMRDLKILGDQAEETAGAFSGMNQALDLTGFGDAWNENFNIIMDVTEAQRAYEASIEKATKSNEAAFKRSAEAIEEFTERANRSVPRDAMSPGNVSGDPFSTMSPELMGMLAGAAAQAVSQLGNLAAILDPLNLLLQGFLSAVGQTINQAIAPLVGIVVTLGQMIGAVLLPFIEIAAGSFKALADLWVWGYNHVFRHVFNVLIVAANIVQNIFWGFGQVLTKVVNGMIDIHNLLRRNKFHLEHVSNPMGSSPRGATEGTLGEISVSDLTNTGNDFGGGVTGGGATYTTGRNITVNIDIFTDVIAGEGGIRDLSLMIRDEIRSAEALGA